MPECGCLVKTGLGHGVYGWTIEYCPLHAAAGELLKACKAQHEAIDRLLALAVAFVDGFLPSKCGQPWEAVVQGNGAIAAAEGRKP